MACLNLPSELIVEVRFELGNLPVIYVSHRVITDCHLQRSHGIEELQDTVGPT